MKTPEEILKSHGIMNDGMHIHSNLNRLYPTIIKSMLEYHAQYAQGEGQPEKQETCKWVDSISNPKYSVSTCENIALPIKELYKYGVKFCPFCGLKIERI